MRQPGRLIARFVTTALSFALAALSAEWLVRQLPMSDKLGWNLVPPIEARIRSTSRTPHEIRLIGVGDSFTEFRDTQGQNYLRTVERRFQEGGRNIGIYNLGEAGTGVKRYLANLTQYGSDPHPDIVTVGLYLGNDLLDYEQELRLAGHVTTVPDVANPPAESLRERIRRQSVLANLAFRFLKVQFKFLRSGVFDRDVASLSTIYGIDLSRLIQREGSVDPNLLDRARADQINPWTLAYGLAQPELYSDMYFLNPRSLFPPALEQLQADLLRIRNKATELHAKLVVVLIPNSILIDKRYFPFFERCGYTLSPRLLETPTLVSDLELFLRSQDISFVDPIPALRKSPKVVYIDDDEHWNAEGQRIAGVELYEFLETHGYPTRGGQGH